MPCCGCTTSKFINTTSASCGYSSYNPFKLLLVCSKKNYIPYIINYRLAIRIPTGDMWGG